MFRYRCLAVFSKFFSIFFFVQVKECFDFLILKFLFLLSENCINFQEVEIADYENKIAKLMVETEKQKMLIECGNLQMKDVNNEIHERECIIKKLHSELERTIFSGQQTQCQVDKNLRKLEKLKQEKVVSIICHGLFC